ncbi:hypothetical protein GUB10_13735 [Salegentibacter sp. BLCTC]|uniref:primase-helicase family protein n=1 Tax=Salegentibacter sp. BLCTC TaxID=2697368 RepID=UPI00187B9E1C|nr:primase-helicase family protein [Salegentibacter sp. BLCTC]MBE7641396.1 hypothetical protein [Salegentibacter sp. BLCTC]
MSKVPFILEEGDGTKKISQGDLIAYLEQLGFSYVRFNGESKLVLSRNNILQLTSKDVIIQSIRTLLLSNELYEEFRLFARNFTNHISDAKLRLLGHSNPIDDRDAYNSSRLFFRNNFTITTKENVNVNGYEDLPGVIWQDRIIDRNFAIPKKDEPGQFEIFCKNITGNNKDRFKCLQTFLGYLLHRNKERGENKAIILYDENMGIGDMANGRTGKTMLGRALENCRNLIYYDGKTTNFNGNFIYQRLTETTDIVYYDDLPRNTDFDTFYSYLTTGIQVEKKFKQAFYIKNEKAPKLLISSNHYVKGDGGDSDRARRYEFEICNYYNKDFTPEKEFGNRFFGNEWSNSEWDRFYFFMMKCIQVYLNEGLLEPEPINLKTSKIQCLTNREFSDFAEVYFERNKKLDKRELYKSFKILFPKMKDVAPHKFTKWCKIYSNHKGLVFKDKPSGGQSFCWFNTKSRGNE